MSDRSIIKFVAQLQELGVKLNLVDGELKVKAPKGVLQGSLLDELKEKKQAVQDYLLLLSSAQKKSKSKIPVADRSQSIPLSYGQQRLWFLDQLSQGSAFYNMPMVLRVEGEIDLAQLEKSAKSLIQRHEILRTNFKQDEESLFQVIHDQVDWSINVIDSYGSSEESIKQQISSLCLEPFDLEKDLLFRVHLIRVDEKTSYLINLMHHIIGDAWSTEVLYRELVSIYLFGEASLPKLDVQYADYATWQRDWLKGEVLDNQIQFWEQELNSVPTLALPFDRSRPKLESHKGDRVKISVSKELYKELKAFSEQQGATLFMTLMAAYQVLLARYSGQNDFAVGTPVANRDKEELSNQLGFFINTLAIRSSIEDELSFAGLLSKVKSRLLDAYSHQELPFEQIVDALNVERATSHAPIFQNMLVLNSSSFASQAQSGIDTQALGQSNLAQLKISMLESGHVSAKFDLNCELVEHDEEIKGHLEYNTDLFDRGSAEQIAEHFVLLIEGLLSSPDASVFSIPLLDAGQKTDLLSQGEGQSVAYPEFDNISAYLDQALSAHSDQIALRFEGESLTYQELHRRSDSLAIYLQEQGLVSQAPIALCLERSVDMVVAILAAVKAGSPYLPLDPELPQERLHFMLSDSQAAYVLCQTKTLALFENIEFEGLDQPALLNLEDEALQTVLENVSGDVSNTSIGEDLFNIIYTSGSTGQPKGVMVTQAGILNRIQWMQSEYQLEASDKVLQKTTYSFDVSVWEFIWPLSQGACLVLAKPDGHKDPAYLTELIQQEQISHCHFVPSMLLSWLEFEPQCDIQKVFCSGEALSREAVNQFYQLMPKAELHNLYGPTEAAIDVSYWHCEAGDEQKSVPIGQAVANTQLRILDRQQQLVPVGVAGELHIGGVQLARGYLNRDELNATTFIELELEGQSQRLYKTGDLVRQRRDGLIEYLGRIDHQVKVRGYRIELGEIEARIQSIEGVSLSVVIAAELNGSQQLVAYVSSAQDGEEYREALSTKIKQQLTDQLPAYMVPSVIMVLDELPQLNNGKIDRKRLPKPEYKQAEYKAPETETEKTLAAIWQEVLGIEKVGTQDNFFELGGHSLLATRVLSKLRAELEKDIRLVKLFELPNLFELAQYIDGLSKGSVQANIPKADRNERLMLSYSQQRIWFLEQLNPGSSFYHMPAVLKLQGPFDEARFERSVQHIIQRHENLRTTFVLDESSSFDEPAQIIHDLKDWSIQHHNFVGQDLDENAMKQKAAELLLAPFDLSQGPLFRMHLVQVAEQEYYLIAVMHHIISDGWSIEVLLKEIVATYLLGEQALPALNIQYADFAQWQRKNLSELLQEQENYWCEQLNQVPVLQMPFDRLRPALESHRGASVPFALSKELSQSLKQFSEQQGLTMFMTLMAAYQVLLARYSGQNDFAVGTPIANRNHPDLEPLIGCFINTLAIRVDLEDAQLNFETLSQQVKQSTLQAFEHQDLPFEKIVDALRLERSMSHSPIFQVMLVVNNQALGQNELEHALKQVQGNDSELTVSTVEAEHVSAKFDLNMEISDQGDSIIGHLEYNTDLFDRGSAEQIAEHFVLLIEGLLSSPDASVFSIPLLDAGQKTDLLSQGEGQSVAYPEFDNISAYLDQALSAHSDQIALRFEGESLTYQELHRRSDSLAIYLQEQGLVSQAPIALCLERSVDMVVAILAAVKAGSPYLPLDPELPQERLHFMLSDSQAAYVLCQTKTLALFENIEFEGLDQPALLNLEDEALQTVLENVSGDVSNTSIGEDLFNIIYTSGSTGQPKGVMVTQAGILNRIQWMQSEYQLEASDKVLQKTTYSFDVSVWEFIWPLSQGACLVLAKPDGHKDPAYLTELIQQEQISHCHFVPSMLLSWLEFEPQCDIQKVFCSGEALSREAVNQFYQLMPKAELHNLYGPTEAAIDVSYWHCEAGDEQISVPIGQAVANTQLRILDKQQQLVPVGVAGELYIGGTQLARGYLNRDELNATAFIELELEGQSQRLYKTGDLVRQRRDGLIEYLGRIDHQVKVRGYRIELGEIEARIQSIEGVSLSVVIAAELNGSQQLVAYVSSAQDGEEYKEALSTKIKQQLTDQLPAYMVPSVIMVLDELPQLNNGKIDRKRLPKPEYKQAEYKAPETETEKTLAAIWQEVLGIEKVGTQDNFFELGGHSLLATRVASRIRASLELNLPLLELFNFPELGPLAEFIDTLQWAKRGINRQGINTSSSGSEGSSEDSSEDSGADEQDDDREEFEL